MKKNLPATLATLALLAACSGPPPAPVHAPATAPAATSADGQVIHPDDLTVNLGNNISIRLVLIPAGKFMMGSPKDEPRRVPNEPLPVEVIIDKPFYMSACEVTQEQYEQIMGKNPSKFRGPQNPVDFVNWDMAIDFCKTFAEKTGKPARLATEAEWEYACRAGSTTRLFYGEDKDFKQLPDYAWYAENSDRKTHPVSTKKPNAWGLYDMYGNVWEWCAEPAAATAPATVPAAASNFRPIRGGGWMNDAWLLSSGRRAGDPHTTAADHLGIRLVIDKQ